MKKVIIKEPIWSKKAIGIATWKVTDDLVIEISYINKAGVRVFPHKYFIEKNKLIKYPIMQIRPNVAVYVIPIKDLKIIKEEIKKEEKNE